MNRHGLAVGNALKWVLGTVLKVGTVMLVTPHGTNPLLTGAAWLIGQISHDLKLPSP